MIISYYDYLKEAGVYSARTRLINGWKKNKGNITLTAQQMGTTRTTVRKVVALYQLKGWSGLRDHRQGPNTPHNKIDPDWEDKILSLYQRGPIKTVTSFAKRFNHLYDTTFSKNVFYRVTKQVRNKRKPKRKKKHKKARLRTKYQGEALLHWQFDPKYLTDIPWYVRQMRQYQLPRYQLGFRDVVSGSTFFCYTNTVAKNVVANAVARFFNHLKSYGISPDEVDLQTDNDTAMINSQGEKRTVFTKIIEDVYRATHSRIPPGACWLQGYIESFNNTCEQCFYRVEEYQNRQEFFEKALTWQLTYNLIRQSPALDDQTPYQVAKKRWPRLTADFYLLPPIMYDGTEPMPKIIQEENGGYHLLGKTI